MTAEMQRWLAEFHPFATLATAAELLGCKVEDVQELIDEGKLRAINIAEDANGQIRTLRVYKYSLMHRLLAPGAPLSLDVPLDGITLPHSRPCLLRKEIAGMLACTARHVANLPLRFVAASTGSLARCPLYAREGFLEFLREREV